MDKVELKNETAILPNPCYVQCDDNLELLKSQPNESVNMIYCDILYGTGRNLKQWDQTHRAAPLRLIALLSLS